MSPVKNVSDRRRLPRIGKIHLGVKATAKDGSGKQYPKAVAWFEVHGDDTTPMEAAAAFLDVYGEKPEEIDVVFISNDPKHLPDPWYKAYGGSTGLVCLSDDTEILTRRGWLGIDDIANGDVVVALDTQENVWREEEVQQTVAFRHVGQMLRYRTRSLDALVTPDHRMVYKTHGRASPWTVAPAASLPVNVRLPSCGAAARPEMDIDDDLLRVLAWVITDGGYGPKPYLAIYQAKPHFVREITDLLQRRFGRVRCATRQNNGGPSNRSAVVLPITKFYLGADEIRECMPWLGEDVKQIPRQILASASPRQLRVLFDEMLKGDGSQSPSHGIRFYAGKSKRLADSFQELATRIGQRSSINGPLRGKGQLGQFVVGVARNQEKIHLMKHAPESRLYAGRVWCISVKSGTFVARRHGRVFTTGNCKGNGETALARWDLARDGQRPPGVEGGTWMTTQTKEPVRLEIPCLAEECPMMQAKKCRIVMNLQVMLPEVRGIGVWQIDTSSYNTIHNILDNVEMLKIALPGGIAGVPLKLRRVPMRVHPEGEAKAKTVHVLELAQPNVTYNELIEARQAVQVKMLEAGGEAGPIQGNILAPPEIIDTETPDNLQEESDVDVEPGEVPMSDEEKQEATSAAEEMDPQVPKDTPKFETVGDLLTFCWQKHALDSTEVLKYSGLADIDAMVGLNLQHVYVKVMRKLEAAQEGAAS